MGLLLSAIIGPVFFSLIQGSLEHGFRYAASFAFGILLSDLVYVLITYFGIRYLSEATYFEDTLGYFGGFVLIGFGVHSLFKKKTSRPNSGGIEILKSKKRKAFFKGFGINGINPFVLLFWASIASLVQLKKDYAPLDIFRYYFGILITVFIVDLLKAFVAKRLAHLMTPSLMLVLNKFVGMIIIGFGLRMIWWAYQN